jgi:hypothetical protein
MSVVFRIGMAVAALVGIAGCTTTGTGSGMSRAGDIKANFTWTAQGPTQGQMTATLGDGRVYQGRFFQVTQQTVVDDLGPLWNGWVGRYHWRGWDWWGPQSETITHYSGQVLANLQGSDGFMRCHFRLVDPSSGMGQGGEGRCQLPDGARIRAYFDKGH